MGDLKSLKKQRPVCVVCVLVWLVLFFFFPEGMASSVVCVKLK